MSKVRRDGREEIPHVKAQKRHPREDTPHPRSGAAAEEIPHVQGKRNSNETVAAERRHQRADRLKPQSQKTSQSHHMDYSLV